MSPKQLAHKPAIDAVATLVIVATLVSEGASRLLEIASVFDLLPPWAWALLAGAGTTARLVLGLLNGGTPALIEAEHDERTP